AAIPAQGRLETTGTIEGIYDLKRLSQVVFSTRTEQGGQLLFETEWTLVVRDTGGFGGPRPPKQSVPKIPADTAPLFEVTERTPPAQALLYRLSGDLNPLHADPEFARAVGFEQGPILHGLCTFGYVTRAVVAKACAGDPRRLRALGVQFKKPVWPGETLRTVGYAVDDKIALETFAEDRPEAVVGGAWADIAPSGAAAGANGCATQRSHSASPSASAVACCRPTRRRGLRRTSPSRRPRRPWLRKTRDLARSARVTCWCPSLEGPGRRPT